MFIEFFTKELRSALRSPMIYIFFFLMALAAGLAVSTDSFIIGEAIGNTHKNAPHIITNFVLIFGIVSLLIAAAFFNNAALRDSKNQFQEIMFSLPVSKSGYFWGRFLGALVLSTIPLLGIFLGVEVGALLAKLAGWVDAERFGTFQLEVLINNYLLFILPNMFVAGSIIFFLAHKWQNTIISFVGVLVIIVAYLVTGSLMSDIENEQLGALLDIFGVRTYGVFTKYWTPVEKNTLVPPIAGLLLYNRLIWLAVGTVISVVSYSVFKLKLNQAGNKTKSNAKEVDPVAQLLPKPAVHAQFNFGTDWAHFKSFFKLNFLNIVKSNVFKILIVFSLVLLVVSMVQGYEYYGLQSYPVTYTILDDITGSTGLFTIIIVVFFSGELVWRDRTERINEVINATPHQSLASVFAQFFALLSIATLLHAIFVFVDICSQLLRGFTNVKLEVYVVDYFVDIFPSWFLYIALFMLIQTLLSNRYVGYFVSILVFMVWSLLLGVLDIESNMLDLGGGPSIRYSDMSGFGSGLTGAIWFGLYWILLGVIMLFKASFYWPRTAVTGFVYRMKSAFSNASPKTLKIFGAFCILWVLVASNVFYNTQILNSYTSEDQQEEILANYEKQYKKYRDAPHPTITDVTYHIDIYPEERNLKTKSELKLVNKTNHPIDSIHFVVNDDWETTIDIAGAKLVLNDQEIGYQIYELSTPVQPGATMEMTIVNNYTTIGFENGVGNTSIQQNGTFINSSTILPNMGYSSNYELSEKYTRKKYDLEPKERMPQLAHSCGDMCNVNYLTDGAADWVNVETYISTSGNQIAVAPGSLIKEWNEDGRNHYHYKVDHKAQNFFSFISAIYQVERAKYKDIDIEIYYDEDHAYNIQKMVDAVSRSLAYYEKNFGPYYHKQARIIEFPRYATFA
jgi:ABC-type transport system involved in multi-copper enzyme maturation permease subunit